MRVARTKTKSATVKPGNAKASETEPAAEWVAIERLIPWAKNPRKNDKAVDRVAESIRTFGFGAPLLARKANGEIIAGHTRIQAAAKVGLARLPVRYLDLTEDQAHLLALADNKLGEIASWDDAVLGQVLADLKSGGVDIGPSGFAEHELRKILEAAGATRSGDEDDIPEPPPKPITKLGDVWLLGRHRLICGDSTKAETFGRLMGGERAALLWTDPPYNVDYQGGTKRGLKIENDAMGDEQFGSFLSESFAACDGVMAEGACCYIAYADKESFNFYAAVRSVGWKHACTIQWVKDSLVLGRGDYHSRHEPIIYGWKLGGPHHPVADRKQDTVWEIARPKQSEDHPTMKPLELIERAIVNSTKADAIVLDAFAGSGSTLIACETTGRRARAVELDPAYCDVIVARWEKLTGQKARRG